jgi:hypothetical protein
VGNGTWDGTGITSATAAQSNALNPESRSIGYANNGSLPLGSKATFRGQPVDATSILIIYTRTGDVDLDGVVGNNDVTVIGANYAPGVPRPFWALGDLDYNGFVDNDDVTLMGAFYNPTAPGFPPPPAPAPLAAAGDGVSSDSHAAFFSSLGASSSNGTSANGAADTADNELLDLLACAVSDSTSNSNGRTVVAPKGSSADLWAD